MMAQFKWYLEPLPSSTLQKRRRKNKSNVDPLGQNFLDPHMIFMQILVNTL